MRKTHPPYSPEFCRQMVALVRTGRAEGRVMRCLWPRRVLPFPPAAGDRVQARAMDRAHAKMRQPAH